MFSVVRTDVCSKTRACPKVMGTNLELMPYTQPHQTKYLRTACSDASSPVSTSLLTHFPFILNRTQMLAFQHWKKEKPKYQVPQIAKERHFTFGRHPAKDSKLIILHDLQVASWKEKAAWSTWILMFTERCDAGKFWPQQNPAYLGNKTSPSAWTPPGETVILGGNGRSLASGIQDRPQTSAFWRHAFCSCTSHWKYMTTITP